MLNQALLERAAIAAIIVFACAACSTPAQPAEPAGVPPICLSRGEATRSDGTLLIDTPITRAVLPGTDGNRGGIEIEVLGLTEQQRPAASGRVLQQVGLKLRSQDPCNAIFVMWPLGPDARLRVMTKINEGQSTFAECRAGGYHTIRPETATELAPLQVGEPRRLEAAIVDRQLTVTIDGRLAWRGPIGSDAARLAGPLGLRSDNLRLRLRWVGPVPAAAADSAGAARPPGPACRRVVQADRAAATA